MRALLCGGCPTSGISRCPRRRPLPYGALMPASAADSAPDDVAQAAPQRRIFVSYRRQDTAVHAGYLAQTLGSLGAGDVFLDVEEMTLGEDFVERIHYEVGRCDVLMVLIGRAWLEAPDADGRPRLWNPLDWV